MKKLAQLLALATLFAAGCQTDQTANNPLGCDEGAVISISLQPTTRTSLGNKGDNGIYPVYWSEGDKIAVNGVESNEVKIDAENRAKASFAFTTATPSRPYYITYPYCASTTAGQPVVEFLAEQGYAEGTFALGSTPMCGYSETSGSTISLSHLASVLRLPIKAKENGAILEKVVITSMSGAKLSGEFAVDCKNATISATENTSSSVTYKLPANFALSTTDVSALYIALPAVEVGNCTIDFVEASGEKMVASWAPNKPLSKGIVREFNTIEYKSKSYTTLQPLEVEEDSFEIFYKKVYGNVRYSDGTPIANVAVSDGFQVVTTDANGYYEMEGLTYDNRYIYCSLPNDVVVPIDELGRPGFFQKYPANSPRYDFTFEKLQGGPESEFSLFAIADTHGTSSNAINRLKVECVGGIKAEKQRRTPTPCYSIICGDIVCSSYLDTLEESAQQVAFMDEMVSAFAPSQTDGVPTFYVMGNHDYDIWDFKSLRYATLETLNYHAQDAYEAHFGPANYSFNRGNTHIVCMRDILWPQSCIDNLTSADCYCGFMDYQVEWLRQDLANVPKSKKVILCVHIPLVEYYHRTDDKYANVHIKEVVDMISEYAEPQIFSGHTHENRDFKGGSTKFDYSSPVSEKTIVGNWSRGVTVTENGFVEKLAGDGAPYGFDVYDIAGATFTNHYFVDCTSDKSHNFDTDYVMRTYITSDVYGGDCDGDGQIYTNSSHLSHERYFKFYSTTAYNSSNELRYDTYFHVNIFNGSPDTWSVKLYVDGKYVKDLAWAKQNHDNGWESESPTKFEWAGSGSGTIEDPWRTSALSNSQDWWYIAYVVNETAATSGQTTDGKCHHKWYGYIPVVHMENIKSGNFYIEATHTEFGQTKVYRTNKIFGRNEYNGYINYKPKNE